MCGNRLLSGKEIIQPKGVVFKDKSGKKFGEYDTKCTILTGGSPMDITGSQPRIWQWFHFDPLPLKDCREIFLSSRRWNYPEKSGMFIPSAQSPDWIWTAIRLPDVGALLLRFSLQAALSRNWNTGKMGMFLTSGLSIAVRVSRADFMLKAGADFIRGRSHCYWLLTQRLG